MPEAQEPFADAKIGHNHPPAEPAPLIPERLVDADALPDLLAKNYVALAERSAELKAACERWLAGRIVPRPSDWKEGAAWPVTYSIESDEVNNRTSDFLRQLAAFAGGRTAASGEVHEARRAVTDPLAAATKVATAWFDNLRTAIRADMEIMDAAQTKFLRDKADAARREREREAEAARVHAEKALAEARAMQGDADAVATAIRAEEDVERAERRVEAPVAAMVRSSSAGGTTTTLRSVWKFKVVNLMDLVKAVAEGKASIDYLTTNDTMIGTAIKSAGRREIPGLDIYDDARASRSGRGA